MILVHHCRKQSFNLWWQRSVLLWTVLLFIQFTVESRNNDRIRNRSNELILLVNVSSYLHSQQTQHSIWSLNFFMLLNFSTRALWRESDRQAAVWPWDMKTSRLVLKCVTWCDGGVIGVEHQCVSRESSCCSLSLSPSELSSVSRRLRFSCCFHRLQRRRASTTQTNNTNNTNNTESDWTSWTEDWQEVDHSHSSDPSLQV